MQKTNEVVKAGRRIGKKVMASDTAQDVVGVVVDGLERVVVDKADDVADDVKTRAARVGDRAKKSTAKKSTAKKSTAKKSTAKKSSSRKPVSLRSATRSTARR
jgi:hypothetical protein